jgi:hypothetical protein
VEVHCILMYPTAEDFEIFLSQNIFLLLAEPKVKVDGRMMTLLLSLIIANIYLSVSQ